MLLYGTIKGKYNEIKLFHECRGRHLCWKRLEVFVCVRMVSAEASAQEMTALHHSIKKSTKRKVVGSIAIKEYSMSRDSTRQLSPNFKVREFACKGSDVVLLDDELVVLLQCIREHFGKPVYITSGYRTAAHNAAVGGSKSSQHLLGRAADFHVEGVPVAAVAAYAETLLPSRGGIGRYPKDAAHPKRSTGWVHIDTRAARAGGRCKKTLKRLLLLQYESGPLPEKGRGPLSCSNAPAGGNTGGGVRFMNRRAGGRRVGCAGCRRVQRDYLFWASRRLAHNSRSCRW